MQVSGQLLLPRPRARLSFRNKCHCGGEGWGEGATRKPNDPSPRPSPHSHIPSEYRVASGERGQNERHLFYDAHPTRESDYVDRCPIRPAW